MHAVKARWHVCCTVQCNKCSDVLVTFSPKLCSHSSGLHPPLDTPLCKPGFSMQAKH
jgi:hypothetical protein